MSIICRIGAAIILDILSVPPVYSRLLNNPLCTLLYEDISRGPDDWEDVRYNACMLILLLSFNWIELLCLLLYYSHMEGESKFWEYFEYTAFGATEQLIKTLADSCFSLGNRLSFFCPCRCSWGFPVTLPLLRLVCTSTTLTFVPGFRREHRGLSQAEYSAGSL